MIWELGEKGLFKYWYHELQHCLLAVVASDSGLCTHHQPTYPAGSVLWMSFPFPKIVTKCMKIWKGLNRALNQLARRSFESEHVKPGRRGTSSCTDGMSSASPGVPGTQTQDSHGEGNGTGSDCGTRKWGSNSTGIAALWLLAGAPLLALIAVACARTGAEWTKSWLSHSSEAGTNPGKEGGWERRSGLAKNMSRNPQGPTGEQC